MKTIEAIAGQGIIHTSSIRPETDILRSQFARHDQLIGINPGFIPDAIFPYSFGIFAGASIAGAFPREVAFQLAETRANIVRKAEQNKPEEERSAMAVILASRDKISELLAQFPGLDWTNDNGPGAHVLGGSMRELRLLADEAGKRFRGYLTAEGIYHSDEREEEARQFSEILQNTEIKDPKIPIIPSTGKMKEITTAEGVIEEMVGSMVRKVNLEEVVRYWGQKGYEAVIDISNGGTIKNLVTRFNNGFHFESLEEEVEKLREFFANIKSQKPRSKIILP